MLFRSYDIDTNPATGITYEPLILSTGTRPMPQNTSAEALVTETDFQRESRQYVGRVGINTLAPTYNIYRDANTQLTKTNLSPEPSFYQLDSALVIAGDLRVGVSANPVSLQAPGGEPQLLFSGGPQMTRETGVLDNSENQDTIYMQRINFNEFSSGIVTSVGDSNADAVDAMFAVGYSDNSTAAWNPVFTMRAIALEKKQEGTFAVAPGGVVNLESPEGKIGIGTSATEAKALLHVTGDKASTSPVTLPFLVKFDTLALLENTSTADDTNGVLINFTGNPAGLDEETNLLTFMIGTTSELVDARLQGAVEGDGQGVMFTSQGADYAEYIPKRSKSEQLDKGDIVGVFAGKVTRETKGADHIMVMSSAPIVVGNWKGDDKSLDYGLVAFLGQVPIKVRGPIRTGDFIVPDGEGKGIGVAVHPSQVSTMMIDKIVGQSIETNLGEGIHKVKSFVGFNFGTSTVLHQLAEIDQLKDDLTVIKANNEKIKTTYSDELAKREKQIALLKAAIEGLKEN